MRNHSGFDVILGNPPWEEATIEENAFWARYFPGLRGLDQRNQEKEKKDLKERWPNLFKEFEDKIIVKDYESFDQYNLIYRHKTLSPATVRKFLDKAYKKYYASPVWLFKFLKSFMLNA